MKLRNIFFSLSLFFLLITLSQFYIYKFIVLYEIKKVSVPNFSKDVGKSGGAVDPLDAVLLQSLAVFSDPAVRRPDFTKKQTGIVGELWIDRCEVTKGSFDQFVTWSSDKPSTLVMHVKTPKNWLFSSSVSAHRVAGQPSMPVGGVSFFDAFAYCGSAGGRLLTSFEYQALAMGENGYLYPWGNVFEKELWPYENTWLNTYQVCNRNSVDLTADGIAHLASHVSEWVWDTHRQLPVIQGVQDDQLALGVFALTVVQQEAGFKERNSFTGFRCAYDKTVTNTPWLSQVDAVKVGAKKATVGVSETSLLPRVIRYMDVEAYPLIAAMLENTETSLMTAVMASEVSVKQYGYFLRDPFVQSKFYANEREPEGVDYMPAGWDKQKENKNLAVRAVNWWSADAFARWSGGRLPTEFEWIHLFSNGAKTQFPWGDELLYLGVTQERQRQLPVSININTLDVNFHGVEHLAGNVSEWTSTLQIGPTGHRLVVKGGNFMLPAEETSRLHFSLPLLPGQVSLHTGFRVIFPD